MHAATVGGGFVVGDAGTARHLEAAVFANTHAAAVGGGVGIIRIRAADGAAGHLEGAAAADYIHAAAVFGGIIAGDGGDVLAVGGRGHGEFAAVHTHAAASVGGVGIILIRAADAAAGHLEGAAAADYIHAAAVFGGIIAGDGGDVLAVGGRGHGEATFAGHIHAAASVGFVAGDAAAGHLEVGLRIYAAAAIGGRVGLTRFRAADGAAGHGESAAVHIHAAASALGVLGFVAGNRAAVHIEGAGTHIHASAGLAACMGDRADALAVGEGDAAAGHIDGIHSVCGRDFVPVETEGDIVLNLNGILQANVTAEVVSASRKYVECIVTAFCRCPGFVAYFQRVALLLNLLFKCGLVGFVFVTAAVTGAAPAKVVGVPVCCFRPHRGRN